MTDAPTGPPDGQTNRPLYVEEDLFGYHIASPDDRPDRVLDPDTPWVPDEDIRIEGPDEIRVSAGTRLILEATDLIEIRASQVDFVHLPGIDSAAERVAQARSRTGSNRLEWVTAEAVIHCAHGGRVALNPSQQWVTVQGIPVVVKNDPERGRIASCPNYGPTLKPCMVALKVAQGYSTWIRVDGAPVVLSNLDGLTDGTPPGIVHYAVRDPGQTFLAADK
jgi:hypothetical protein